MATEADGERIGLVLGGGGARVGVLKVLQEEGIALDFGELNGERELAGCQLPGARTLLMRRRGDTEQLFALPTDPGISPEVGLRSRPVCPYRTSNVSSARF